MTEIRGQSGEGRFGPTDSASTATRTDGRAEPYPSRKPAERMIGFAGLEGLLRADETALRASARGAADPRSAAELEAAYRTRCDALIGFYADRNPDGYIDRVDLIEAAAKLYLKRDLAGAFRIIDAALPQPNGDMFWMYPNVLINYLGRDVLPEDYRARLRDLWRTYTPYRGDTENHWVMYYASLYLMAELYPDEPPDRWFNGLSSAENLEEAREFLEHWVEITTTIGQGEYDSPHYMGFFIMPMALLYAFADDGDVRLRAGMMLDYLIADFAVDSLNGLYAGAFSRIYPEPLLERWRNGSTSFAWLLFGNVPFRPDRINVILPRLGYRPHAVSAILAMSGYTPHEILHHIATDRSKPYIHRELKRTRYRIRYSDTRTEPVYKYVYMCREYAVGSTQGGLLQPIQQHTWEVMWATPDPFEGYNVLFTIHPYSSGHELGMYFPEEPRLLTRSVLQEKKETYDSPDKWTGASPYEQMFQHQDSVVALYDIPENTRFPHISGYFSRNLSSLIEDESGWIFAIGGDALIAYYPLASYEWLDEPGGDLRLHSSRLKNGAVIQVAPGSTRTFDEFRTSVKALPLTTSTEPVPRVSFRSLRGARIEVAYGEVPRVNGSPVDYENWPLSDGPHMHAPRGSGRLELRYGARRRSLDFRNLTVHDAG